MLPDAPGCSERILNETGSQLSTKLGGREEEEGIEECQIWNDVIGQWKQGGRGGGGESVAQS